MLKNNLHRHRAQSGFGLIEIITVATIISILAAIAIVFYNRSTQKSRQAAVKSALSDLYTRQQKYYVRNNNYANDLTSLGYASSKTFSVTDGGSSAYYKVRVNVIDATNNSVAAFSAIATPIGSQVGDKCGSYTINSAGEQGNLNAKNGKRCW